MLVVVGNPHLLLTEPITPIRVCTMLLGFTSSRTRATFMLGNSSCNNSLQLLPQFQLPPPIVPLVPTHVHTLSARPIGEAGNSPSLIACEVKVECPLTFGGKHSALTNFIFVLR